jgi:glutaredoxin
LLVSAGALSYRVWRGVVQSDVAAEQPAADGDTPLAQHAPLADDALPPASTAPDSEPSEARGESLPLTEPLPGPRVAELEPEPPPPAGSAQDGSAAPAPAAATGARTPPTDAELRAALKARPIVMYATSWCGVCQRARQFLGENGLSYREIDADRTPGGWAAVEMLIGRRAVPVIVVDGDVTAGLSPERIMNATARSMERRLGLSGIRFRSQ